MLKDGQKADCEVWWVAGADCSGELRISLGEVDRGVLQRRNGNEWTARKDESQKRD
jgi:hypothetical protein